MFRIRSTGRRRRVKGFRLALFAGASLAAGAAAQQTPAPASGVPAVPAPEQTTAPAAPVTPQVPAAPATAATVGGIIRGTVKAGPVPLPGVAVTATNTLTGKKYATTTDVTGAYAMTIPRTGRYVVRAELSAFQPLTREVRITAEAADQVAEFGLELASRAAAAAQAAGQTDQNAQVRALASALGRGTQSLSMEGDAAQEGATAGGGGNQGAALPSLGGLGEAGAAGATESYAVSGQQGSVNQLAGVSEDDIRQRITDAIDNARRQGGAEGAQADAIVGMLGPLLGPGGGGLGGGGGGRGGRGGGGGGFGGFRGFNPTQPHGSIFYQGSYGALNALPFSLSGAPEQRLNNQQNRFGISFTGSPGIPGLLKADPKQFIFFNVTGTRNISPFNQYAIVPTVAERGGNFQSLTQDVNGISTPITIYDPLTGAPFVCNGAANVICPNRISAQALALLNYYPAPNIPVTGNQNYNYQTITNAGNNQTQASLRYVRNFGAQPTFGQGRRSQRNGPATLRQNINFSGSYSDSAADNVSIFLPLGGKTQTTGYAITAGYTVGYGKLTNNASLNWNRSHANTFNFFTDTGVNPATQSGVLVGNQSIQSNPFYFGVPNLTFSGFNGISTQTPSNNINQTISFSDFVSYSRHKHNFRLGLDVRRLHNDLIGGTNVLGSFVFSGYATEASPGTTNTTTTGPSGAGFADFLLGLPQQASVQASLNKIYLRENILDWYVQDDYRVLSNVTLNYGLRYEYFSPYVEKYNRLTNLDHNADFTSIALVLPGQVGSVSGTSFPRSLVNPDKALYSPRFGVAWRPKQFKEVVVRAGYGLNYNTTQFSRFAQRLSDQQPFSVTQTNIANEQGCGNLYGFTLANAYNCSTAPVQSNYGVDPFYRLGHVQIYNVDIQKTLGLGVVVNVGYTGSKGGDLDIVRAPNRTATGLLDANAQAFNYEDSLGFSRQNNLAVNARKRLQKGVSLQATYTYGHSIDDASSINGTGNSVAQNDKNLVAEESNSSFDVRQQLTGNFLYELPVGPNRAFLSKGGKLAAALDGFNVSGSFTFASGSYFTPQYTATAAETATGTNSSLRPDRVFSQPINGAKTFTQWFNPLAFTTPANGFGTASRFSIEGPGVVQFNASLSRTFSFGDTRSFETRLTAANAFNTVQYSGINTTENSQNFGQVTSVAGMRTLTFLARYRF